MLNLSMQPVKSGGLGPKPKHEPVECGGLDACHSLANGYLKGVQKTLSKYPDEEPRRLFEGLLEYMVKRGH